MAVKWNEQTGVLASASRDSTVKVSLGGCE